MSEIKLAIEGSGAVVATEELFQSGILLGSWETVGDQNKLVDLATVATILGIAGGSITIAEQLYQWYTRWAIGQQGQTLQKVVIVDSKGKRLQLSDATPAQVAQFLDVLK